MSTLDRPRPAVPSASPAAMAPLSDSALAAMVARGRDSAFEVLYERYRADLSRYCRALLRNPEDAEEAFQGTMLNALRALRSGEGGRNMRPWLYRIAHNQCASMIRARRPSSALSPEQPSPADPPEDQVALAEQIRHLRADLGSLPALQRSALVMREMSGLSHRAIAQALSVEPADARQLVYEARRSLDECRIGREAGCAELRTQIADGDRRRLRSRRVRAHLRTCADCTAYVASQVERRRGYAALAPAIPAAAGKQVFDRVMGSSGAAGAAAGGGAVIGIPGGVAGTIAGLAAGLSPANSARAWARLPDSTATGLAGAGATAGVALLSLALTALLLSGDNAAHGSAVGPPTPPGKVAPLEVAVVAPPGASSIGYRVSAAADGGGPAPTPDTTTVPGPATASGPLPDAPISISIEGEVIPERPFPEPVGVDPPPTFEAGLEIVDLPDAPPARPGAASPRPRLVDPTLPAPAPAAPAPAVEGPTEAAAVVPEAVGSGSDPDPEPGAAETEPVATPATESDTVDQAADPEVGSVPDPEPAAAADPEVGSVPDPEPTAAQVETDADADSGETIVVAAGEPADDESVRDEADDTGGPEDADAGAETGQTSDEVGSVPDPEPGSTEFDETADDDAIVDCPVDPST